MVRILQSCLLLPTLLCGCAATRPLAMFSPPAHSPSPAKNTPAADDAVKQEAESSSGVESTAEQPAATKRRSGRTIDDMLLFFPVQHPEGDWTADARIEDVWIQSADGTKIHAWYCPAPKPRAVVLFCHGNGGNVTHRRDLLLKLRSMGISTMALDYRGYGRSEGRPSKPGSIADAAAARSKLAEVANVPLASIVLMGRSLGGAIAIQLAAQRPPRGLIVESTFSSLYEIAKEHFPALAWMITRQQLNSLEALAKYSGPLLHSHGDRDRTIPIEQAKKLHTVATGEKQFVLIPAGTHNSPQPQHYYDAFSRFIDSLAAPVTQNAK